ncbi:DUF5956 family protein [Nocardioides agariphilus]|uniref:DUF5956 family protein n=1 Tax=Nocardioides agariphilus TaxID=433664 RepID=UPI003520D99A
MQMPDSLHTPCMESADWGGDTEPLHLGGIPDGRFSPTDSDDPLEVPAVRAAREQGFEPAPEAPLWTFLPAVWPVVARAWIPDTRIRHMEVACDGEPLRTLPWSSADYFELEADANRLLAECGLTSRPPGRLWLLKPPQEFVSLDATLSWLVRSAKEAGLDIVANQPFVLRVQRDLDVLFASGT